MKIKLIILLLLTALIINAQDNYMSLSFGVGNPLGDFAKSESLSTDGFANLGFMADYSGAYYPFYYIGIGGSVKFNQSAIEAEKVKQELIDLLPQEITDAINRVDMGYWSNVSFGVGPQFTLPLNIIDIDLFVFPGLHIVAPPRMDLSVEISGTEYYTTLSSQNLRFGIESGINVRLNLGETAGIRLFASYLQTSSKGELEWSEDQAERIQFNRKIQIVNTGIGLIYKL